MIERASGRDLFLRYHDAVPSRLYQSETVRSAQAFVSAAARRNVVEEVIEAATVYESARLKRGSEYEAQCERYPKVPMCPDRDATDEPRWLQVRHGPCLSTSKGHAFPNLETNRGGYRCASHSPCLSLDLSLRDVP